MSAQDIYSQNLTTEYTEFQYDDDNAVTGHEAVLDCTATSYSHLSRNVNPDLNYMSAPDLIYDITSYSYVNADTGYKPPPDHVVYHSASSVEDSKGYMSAPNCTSVATGHSHVSNINTNADAGYKSTLYHEPYNPCVSSDIEANTSSTNTYYSEIHSGKTILTLTSTHLIFYSCSAPLCRDKQSRRAPIRPRTSPGYIGEEHNDACYDSQTH